MQFGKKQDAAVQLTPDGGVAFKSKYFEVSALKVDNKDLADYIAMVVKHREFSYFMNGVLAQFNHDSVLNRLVETNLPAMRWRSQT